VDPTILNPSLLKPAPFDFGENYEENAFASDLVRFFCFVFVFVFDFGFGFGFGLVLVLVWFVFGLVCLLFLFLFCYFWVLGLKVYRFIGFGFLGF
jgi:hypothetical protein